MDKRIRFINSDYQTLFWIDDGGEIIVIHADGLKFTYRCRFLDECHFESENTRGYHDCWHICQWAERMEQNGNIYMPAVPSYNLYQLDRNKGDRFTMRYLLSLKQLDGVNLQVEKELYRLCRSEPLGELQKKGEKSTLNAIFRQFKDRKKCPEDFQGMALSTSDVVVLMADGKQRAFYRDPDGFVKIEW